MEPLGPERGFIQPSRFANSGVGGGFLFPSTRWGVNPLGFLLELLRLLWLLMHFLLCFFSGLILW